MASRDKQLHEDLSAILRNRPGWSIQESPTPGVGRYWAFAPHGRVDFSVFTDGGAVHLYEEETDRELRFETIEELTACLDADEATALPSTPGESRRPYFHWR